MCKTWQLTVKKMKALAEEVLAYIIHMIFSVFSIMVIQYIRSISGIVLGLVSWDANSSWVNNKEICPVCSFEHCFYFPELKATAVCLSKPDINEAGGKWRALSRGTAPHKSSPRWLKWFAQDEPRFLFCLFKARVRATQNCSVSWLSSLTETKRLSFLQTPPHSLKCHRKALSFWMEQQCQASWCCFSSGIFSFLFPWLRFCISFPT